MLKDLGLKALLDRIHLPGTDRWLTVLIDTTNGCNYRCVFCPRKNTQIDVMATLDFEMILNKVHRYTRKLQLSCAWEYSIAKNAAEIVRSLGRFDIPDTSIYTNGSALSDALAESIITSKVGDFVVSIGESRRDTYERIRLGGRHEKVIENIRKLHRMKAFLKSRYPRLCANLTIIRSNIGELLEFVDLSHEIGITEIRGRHLILNEGVDYTSQIILDRKGANRIIRRAKDKARRLGICFDVPFYEEEPSRKNCRAPWDQLYIQSNGDVSPCPRISRQVTLGNLNHSDLSTLLQCDAVVDFRRQMTVGCFNNSVCGVCQSGSESFVAIDQGF